MKRKKSTRRSFETVTEIFELLRRNKGVYFSPARIARELDLAHSQCVRYLNLILLIQNMPGLVKLDKKYILAGVGYR